MKVAIKFLFSLLLSVIFGTAVAQGLGTDPGATVATCIGISFALSFVPQSVGAFEVVLQSMIETELLREIRFQHRFLETIPSKNEYVNNNIINLTEIGVDPDVLINNTTYPIAVLSATDDNLPISLTKFDTKNTKVSRDELYALAYDKVSIYRDKHRKALEEKAAIKGLHSLAPASDSLATPVIECTGTPREGRFTLSYADLVRAKDRLTKAGMPLEGRVLVLCSDHIADLLINDGKLMDRYKNHKEGVIVERYAGFAIYEDIYTVTFAANGTKKSFDAAPVGTDRNASVFYYAPRTVRANGDVEAFLSEAKSDPEYRQSKFGARLWNVVLPVKQAGIGAILNKLDA